MPSISSQNRFIVLEPLVDLDDLDDLEDWDAWSASILEISVLSLKIA